MSSSLAYNGAGSTLASRSGSWFLRIMVLPVHIACQEKNVLRKQGQPPHARLAKAPAPAAGVNIDRAAAAQIRDTEAIAIWPCTEVNNSCACLPRPCACHRRAKLSARNIASSRAWLHASPVVAME